MALKKYKNWTFYTKSWNIQWCLSVYNWKIAKYLRYWKKMTNYRYFRHFYFLNWRLNCVYLSKFALFNNWAIATVMFVSVYLPMHQQPIKFKLMGCVHRGEGIVLGPKDLFKKVTNKWPLNWNIKSSYLWAVDTSFHLRFFTRKKSLLHGIKSWSVWHFQTFSS